LLPALLQKKHELFFFFVAYRPNFQPSSSCASATLPIQSVKNESKSKCWLYQFSGKMLLIFADLGFGRKDQYLVLPRIHTRDGLAYRSLKELQQVIRKRRIERKQPIDEAGAMGDAKSMRPCSKNSVCTECCAVTVVLLSGQLLGDIRLPRAKRVAFKEPRAELQFKNLFTRAELHFKGAFCFFGRPLA
jgi:hypothetical protein